jgi:hypothetical protein
MNLDSFDVYEKMEANEFLTKCWSDVDDDFRGDIDDAIYYCVLYCIRMTKQKIEGSIQ